MSDSELEAIRRKKMRELMERISSRKEDKKKRIDPEEVLGRVFRGRAWEVYRAAYAQYPQVMERVKDALVRLVLAGRLNEINGEQLYLFLRRLGLRVRLETKIKVLEHGKLKSLADKLKEGI